MGTGWSQDETQQPQEEPNKTSLQKPILTDTMTQVKKQSHNNHGKTQSPKFTATTPPQVKQQLLHKQDDEQERVIISQGSKATATARELMLQHNHEEQHKKKMMSPSYEVSSRVNGAKTEAKVPHNLEAIVKDADSPLDKSSIEKLSEQLQSGIFLNQRRKKYWVERKSCSNCFMIYAKDLLITWGEDGRYWQWSNLKETSDESICVAELQNVCWLEVHGSLQINKLSPGVLYEVVFVVMMKDPAYGWEVPVKLKLVLPDGKSLEHDESLNEKPKGRWIDIKVGELRSTTENTGDIQFSLYEYKGGLWKRGLLIKGVAIQPKN